MSATNTPNPSFWADRCGLNKAVFDWCLRNTKRCLRKGAKEASIDWAHLAALMACTFPFDSMASPELEKCLLTIAKDIPVPMPMASRDSELPKQWLHVLTRTGPTGGHNASVRRIIELDGSEHRHSIALLDQKYDVPNVLSDVVQATGGKIIKLSTEASFLRRAIQLRELSIQSDVVILHLYPWDVIPIVAFGVPHGPPVLLMNLADHMFWIGGSVADVILNLRETGQDWLERHRGVSRIRHLPIPLSAPDTMAKAEGSVSDRSKNTREALKIPSDAPVILTSGMAYKYNSVPGLNFFDAAREILLACPEAYLIALGPEDIGPWAELRNTTNGRAIAVGPQTAVTEYYEMADIYIEGFPFGSNTAFLEAGIKSIPCVPVPRVCPALFGSEGVAPSILERPNDVAEYVRRAIVLIADKDERRRCGGALAVAIKKRHIGMEWLGYLRRIEEQLPPSHIVYEILDPEPVPREFADVWAQFSTEWKRNKDPLAEAYHLAIRMGIKPKLDRLLMKTLRSYRHVRGTGTVPDALLTLWNPMMSVLPPSFSQRIYRVSNRVYHSKVTSWFRGAVETLG